jgi:hypothetical protein
MIHIIFTCVCVLYIQHGKDTGTVSYRTSRGTVLYSITQYIYRYIHTYSIYIILYIYIYISGLDSFSEAEIIPGKYSDTRIKPLALTNGHGRYMAVTPERALASVEGCPLHI